MEIWPKTPHVVLLITRSTSDHKLEEKKFQAQFEVRATTLDATRRGAFGFENDHWPKDLSFVGF